jgi:hypothetical protein
MQIQTPPQFTPTSLKGPVQSNQDSPKPPEPPKEEFTPSSEDSGSSSLKFWGPVIATAAVGAGLGVYAGMGTGVLPALAGAAAGTGFGVLGAAGFARAGLDEASGTAGIVGFFGGAVGGAALGYAVSSPVAAVALGAAGGLGFAFYKAMSAWND